MGRALSDDVMNVLDEMAHQLRLYGQHPHGREDMDVTSGPAGIAVRAGLHAVQSGLDLSPGHRLILNDWLSTAIVPDHWRDAVRDMLIAIDDRDVLIAPEIIVWKLKTQATCTRHGSVDESRDVELRIGANRTAAGDHVVLSIVGTNASWYVLSLLGASVCVEGRYPYLHMPDRRVCLDAGQDSWCENFDVVMAEALVALVSHAAAPARFS